MTKDQALDFESLGGQVLEAVGPDPNWIDYKWAGKLTPDPVTLGAFADWCLDNDHELANTVVWMRDHNVFPFRDSSPDFSLTLHYYAWYAEGQVDRPQCAAPGGAFSLVLGHHLVVSPRHHTGYCHFATLYDAVLALRDALVMRGTLMKSSKLIGGEQ